MTERTGGGENNGESAWKIAFGTAEFLLFVGSGKPRGVKNAYGTTALIKFVGYGKPRCEKNAYGTTALL